MLLSIMLLHVLEGGPLACVAWLSPSPGVVIDRYAQTLDTAVAAP